MSLYKNRRQVDFQIIAKWVHDGDRILDLGCGRGILLEYLQQKKSIYGVGVDIDFDKILSCIQRKVNAYQGDVRAILAQFPDGAFDRVIFSRTVEQLEDSAEIIAEALRVGQRATIGFVNAAYWRNRWHFARYGARILNEVYPRPWYQSLPTNAFSIQEFEGFCEQAGIKIVQRVHLRGDWCETCRVLPNLLAGYAIYDITAATS